MTEIAMTEEEFLALEREVAHFEGLDRDSAEIALAEIRRCWSEIADLKARLAEHGL